MLEVLKLPLLAGVPLHYLFVSGFLAAVLIPGGAEAFLIGLLPSNPNLFWPALSTVTLGNTVAGIGSYWIGRCVHIGKAPPGLERLRRYGVPALLLAWVPWFGEGLCIAAGWLRLNPWGAGLCIAAGGFVRFWLLAKAALGVA
jgi:membrane protein YqaA with SNARE-associated domain